MEAIIRGVYGTLHTADGDVDTGRPSKVEIDCELLTFTLTRYGMPFSSELFAWTLHLGTQNVRFDVARQVFGRGDDLTVTQSVLLHVLGKTDDDPPAWSTTDPK